METVYADKPILHSISPFSSPHSSSKRTVSNYHYEAIPTTALSLLYFPLNGEEYGKAAGHLSTWPGGGWWGELGRSPTYIARGWAGHLSTWQGIINGMWSVTIHQISILRAQLPMLAVYPERNEDISYQQTSRLVTLKWCQKQNANFLNKIKKKTKNKSFSTRD